MTSAQSNSKGVLFILMGMALFSVQDALIKFIYEDAALYELYFGRTFIAFILLVAYLKFSKQKISLKTHYLFLTIIRVICFFFGFSFFYISLTYMSLAMANALFFSISFFVFKTPPQGGLTWIPLTSSSCPFRRYARKLELSPKTRTYLTQASTTILPMAVPTPHLRTSRKPLI